MDVGTLTVQYLNGEQENFDISAPNVDKIKAMENRIIISYKKDPETSKKSCKIINIDSLSSFEISPCDVQNLLASSGKR